jgi:hypothetical protein
MALMALAMRARAGAGAGAGVGVDEKDPAAAVGSHLTPLSRLEALNRVEGHYRSNNDPAGIRLGSCSDQVVCCFLHIDQRVRGAQELAEALASMHEVEVVVQHNMASSAPLC